MTLTLLAVSLNDRPLSQPVTAHFDSRGGTIGRADHNTMALPDPERHVSRLQAEVISQGGGFIIRNVGGANPITVAGRSVARGDSAPLLHGDEVRIGGYALQVDCNAQSAALDITRGRALLSAGPVALAQPLQAAQALAPEPAARAQQTPAPAPMPMPATGVPQASANPFADLLGSAAPSSAASSANDPFADLLGQGPLPPVRREAKPGPVVRRAMDLPNDPFAGLMPPPAGLPDTSASAEVLADLAKCRSALSANDEPQRRAVLLSCEGLTHEEIAETTDLPLGTVKSHVRRGLIAIRLALFGGKS